MEAALEISFCFYINLKYGTESFGTFGVWLNYLSIILLGLALIVLIVWIPVFYLRKFEELEDEDFQKKFGDVYEGLKPTQKSVLAFPVYFIVRRILFMVAAFMLIQYVILQTGMMLVITLVAVVYILHTAPFESPLMNKLEVMNECATLILIYFLICFTEITDSTADKYQIGFLFVGGTILCISIHLYFIISDILGSLITSCKKYCKIKVNENNKK